MIYLADLFALDYAAWFLTYTGSVTIAARHRAGWLLLAAGCLLWSWIGWRARYGHRRVWGLVFGNLVTAATAVVSWWQWGKP